MAEPILQNDERNNLIKIVARLSDFTDFDIVGRRQLVNNAGLGKFLPGINWSGSDRIVAGNLVDRLNSYGFLQERPEYHALGRLLAYLLDHPDISTDDKQFMAMLIVKHRLVRDPEYTSKLCTQFSITETLLPESIALSKSELTEPFDIVQPTFAPTVQDKGSLEKTRNSEDNFLDIYLLLGAIYSAEAVGRIELSLQEPWGTGWLIGPDLLLTNRHVLPNQDYVAEATIRFGYQEDAQGVREEGRVFQLDPDFYYYSLEGELDYALVRLKECPLYNKMVEGDMQRWSTLDLIRQGKHRGYLVAAPKRILNLQRVNIIQYPARDSLKVVLTQNYVTADMSSTRVHYLADTKHGSSGSPVFNMGWEVVALHHAGEPYPPDQANVQQNGGGRYGINEGIPMKAILEDFKNTKDAQGRPLIDLLPQVK